jgi:hypothetical protein
MLVCWWLDGWQGSVIDKIKQTKLIVVVELLGAAAGA